MRASGDAWPSDPGFEPRRLRDSYPTVGPQDSQHLTRPHLSNLRFACQGTVEVVRHVRLWAPPSPARVIQRAGEGGSHADTTTRAARPPADEMGATAAATRAGAGSFWSGTHLAARGCRSLPRSRSPTTFPRHRPNSRGCRPGRSPPRRCRVGAAAAVEHPASGLALALAGRRRQGGRCTQETYDGDRGRCQGSVHECSALRWAAPYDTRSSRRRAGWGEASSPVKAEQQSPGRCLPERSVSTRGTGCGVPAYPGDQCALTGTPGRHDTRC